MRLILVPQYPAKLRYQEWWIWEFIDQYGKYFDEVHALGPDVTPQRSAEENFSPIQEAVNYELKQISEFMSLELRRDDVLLLNDLSFPGLFASALVHKRPKRCFAICHATSKNRYDLFQPVRSIKYPMERNSAKLFDEIFVGSQYHANKLGWKNLHVIKLPNYPARMQPKVLPRNKKRLFACASRPNIQKVTKKIEKAVERYYNTKICRPETSSWEEYFQFLQETKFLLITAKEETYGYQVVDALMNGCIPLAPKRYSYPELLPEECLYNSFSELKQRVAFWLCYNEMPKPPKEDFFEITSDIMKGGTYGC